MNRVELSREMNREQFNNRAVRRAVILVVTVFAVCILAFVWGPRIGGEENWTVVMTIATLLAVIAALFLDDFRALLHRPEIEFYVGRDLLDNGHEMNSPDPAQWIRGKIKNIGDRGVEKCRLKILKVEGPNIPYPEQSTKIENGFLQWEGGIRDSMRLNPDESWIFDIGTRRFDRNCDLVLWAYFRPDSAVCCHLRPPGTYTVSLAVYGDNIESKEHEIRIAIGEDAKDIQFPRP